MTNRINEFIPDIPDDDGLILSSDEESHSEELYQDIPDNLMLSNPARSPEATYWKILLVDDDVRVHEVTKMALNQREFAGKSLKVISAYSGEKAKVLMAEHPDTAIVLLDAVMETKDAGLRVAKYIREVLGNKAVRIFLQTEEPGAEIEESVLVNDDINEYNSKGELTQGKLLMRMIAGLKLYRDLVGLEQERQELAKKHERLNIFSLNIEELVKGRTQKLAEKNWQLQQEIQKLQVRESELRKSEERSSLVRGSTGDGIWDWDLQTGEVFYCQGCKGLLGYAEREIGNQGNEWMRRVHPEDMGRVMDAFGLRLNSYSSEASATTPDIVVEYRLRCDDGSYKWILLRGQAIWDVAGQPIRIVGSMAEIGDRKRVEERLQLALEGSALGLWDWNITTNALYLSPQWKQMLGYEVGEIEDSVSFWERLLHPEDLPGAWEDIGVHLDGETPFFKVEFRMLTKSGDWKWIESHGQVCDRDGEGNPLRMTGTHKDITDRKLAEAAVSESEKKYRYLVETSQDMIWSVDGRGHFTFVNQAVKQIHGYEPEEMIGRPFTDFQPPEQQAKDLQAFQCILAGESLFQYETLHLTKDGRPIHLLFNAIGLYDKGGKVIGATGTATNITARKQASSELQQAKVAAEEANRAKSQFLANMSHEIRTPMNGVLGMTELLLSTPLNSQQLDFVQTIKASGDHLLAIINDILDFSKLEAGEMLVDSHEFNLGLCLENLVDLLAYQANSKGLELVLLIDSSVPRQVLGDELRLRQIITNLVGNGIKFTESGSVTIEVTAEKPDNSLTTPVDIDKIDEFTMGDREMSAELLQIFVEDAPSYLENVKGAIAASDYVAVARSAHQLKGASATVAIDSMSRVAAQLEAEAKSNRLSSAVELVARLEMILDRVNIFVIQLSGDGEKVKEVPSLTDNSLTTVPVDRERLHQLCRGDTEFELELLQTFIDDAPSYLENVKEAIAASDYVAVARNAHQLKGASATVAIDSMWTVADKLEAEAKSNRLSSAVELVSQLEMILEQVNSFVAQLLSGEKNSEVRKQTDNSLTTLSEPVDRERLHQLCRGDTEFELELLQTFIEDAPSYLENVKEAIAASDYVAVARNAHQLKGASATVAIDSMWTVADKLEAEAKSNRLSSAMELVSQLEMILEQVNSFVAQLSGSPDQGQAIRPSYDQGQAIRPSYDCEQLTKLRFAVKDTGIGISPAQQKKLFQPFSQVDASTTRKYGGTGLGLAICKQLVEMMGGEIGIDSEMGVGSTFWFTAIFGKVGSPPTPHLALTGKKLLVVDDNPIICQAVGQLAIAWGMLFESTNAAAPGKPYDVVMLDLQVPKIGEIIGQLKQERPQTKLILMTSLHETDAASEFIDLGCDDYLVKPVRESRLLEKLLGIFSEVPDPESRVHHQVISTDDRLLRHGKILLVEDTPVNQKVVLNQLQRLGYQADCVQNGRECLDKLTETNYDILLMDCQMPVLDGYQTTQALRQLEGTERHTVVIGLTANAMKGDREQCLAAGMDDYLSKPVMLSELSAVLQKYCCSLPA